LQKRVRECLEGHGKKLFTNPSGSLLDGYTSVEDYYFHGSSRKPLHEKKRTAGQNKEGPCFNKTKEKDQPLSTNPFESLKNDLSPGRESQGVTGGSTPICFKKGHTIEPPRGREERVLGGTFPTEYRSFSPPKWCNGPKSVHSCRNRILRRSNANSGKKREASFALLQGIVLRARRHWNAGGQLHAAETEAHCDDIRGRKVPCSLRLTKTFNNFYGSSRPRIAVGDDTISKKSRSHLVRKERCARVGKKYIVSRGTKS